MTFTLPEETRELLREINKKTGLKMSTIVDQAIQLLNQTKYAQNN